MSFNEKKLIELWNSKREDKIEKIEVYRGGIYCGFEITFQFPTDVEFENGYTNSLKISDTRIFPVSEGATDEQIEAAVIRLVDQ